MYNPFSLEGKTILVTGASSGIGQATAIECSKLGARLIVTARNEERLMTTFSQLEGEGHRSILADLTDDSQRQTLLESVPAIDGLVLCAGKGMTAPFVFCTKEKFEDVFGVNYFATVELLRLLLKQRKIAKDGSVVFVSSIAGNGSYNYGNTVYGAAKAALNSTMKFCAKELAERTIRVNSVCPGMVNTQLIQNGAISEEQQKKDMERYPLRRYGEPQDIAYGIIYLLSKASSWVTGISLTIDGGFMLK